MRAYQALLDRSRGDEAAVHNGSSLSSQARPNVPVEIPEGCIEHAIRQEQLDGLAKIQREIQGIQSLYEQLAFYVDDQQLGIDGVINLLDSTRDSASQANRELVHARRLSRATTRRKCIIWLVIFCMTALILWILLFLH